MLSERGVGNSASLSTRNVAGISVYEPGARNREPVTGLFVVGIQLGLVRSWARSRTDTSLELERHFQEGRFRWRAFGRSRPENATGCSAAEFNAGTQRLPSRSGNTKRFRKVANFFEFMQLSFIFFRHCPKSVLTHLPPRLHTLGRPSQPLSVLPSKSGCSPCDR